MVRGVTRDMSRGPGRSWRLSDTPRGCGPSNPAPSIGLDPRTEPRARCRREVRRGRRSPVRARSRRLAYSRERRSGPAWGRASRGPRSLVGGAGDRPADATVRTTSTSDVRRWTMAKKGTILVGTIGQGVMMSPDDGESWTRASVRLGMHSDCIVKALSSDHRRPEVVYAGTDLGLYRSDDGGAGWRLMDSPMSGAMVWSLAIDPVDPRVMFAGTGTPSKAGIYRNPDGGQH